jgi:RNA-directed DNA polymerase
MEPFEGKMSETLNSSNICTKLERIAQLAKQIRDRPLRTLAHHMDLEWMREAYRRTRKDAAVGIDEVTSEQYAENLDENLTKLLDRAKSGTYRAAPVRRVHIPKGDGKTTRPIGIPTLEDKVLQRAVAMILQAVYEQEFLDCSYGFRPKRSAHQAVDELQTQLMRMKGGWVVEVDIKSFYDSVSRSLLMGMIRHRVVDGVLLRLIAKWLHAGVMEDGQLSYPELGTPQGGVISPILANIFLHEIMDVWFARDIRPRLRGRAMMVRYADDMAMAFEREDDARRVMAVLPKRFGKYGLTLHPDKTRLVAFQRPQARPKQGNPGREEPGVFDMLGFTLYWGLTRKGRWTIKLKTAKDRFRRAVKRVAAWCKKHRHDKVRTQWKGLCEKLRGHYAYYGITFNSKGLERYLEATKRIWHKWLNRRSQRNAMPWDRMNELLERYPLPRPRIVHPLSFLRPANP